MHIILWITKYYIHVDTYWVWH